MTADVSETSKIVQRGIVFILNVLLETIDVFV